MNPESLSRLRAWLPTFASVAGVASLLVGVGVLFGWAFDIQLLKTLLPGLPRMPANTALAFVSLGLSLLLLRDRQAGPVRCRERRASSPTERDAARRLVRKAGGGGVPEGTSTTSNDADQSAPQVPRPSDYLLASLGQLFALLVALFGFLVVGEYLFGWDLGIDQILFRDNEVLHPGVDLLPGRPALDTALSFIMLGLALLFLDKKAWRGFYPAELLLVIGAISPLVTLIGYVDAARALYGLPVEVPHDVMSLHTSVTLLLLSAGGLAARPERGLPSLLTGEGPGSTMTRYLLLAVILLPLAVALLLIVGDLAGFHVPRLVLLLVTLCIALGAIVLLWSVARLLNREHEERKSTREALLQSEERLRQLIESAPDGIFVADIKGRYTDVNPVGARMLGYTREEIVGKSITDLLPPEDVPRLWAHQKKLLGGESGSLEWRLLQKSGRYLDVEVSDTILPDGRWQGLVRDISERRALEEERRRLYDEEQRLRARLEVLDSASRQISEATATLDGGGVGEVLKAIARQAQLATGAKHVALGLGKDPQKPFSPWLSLSQDPETIQLLDRHPRPVGLLGKVAREGETIRLRDVRQHPAFGGLPREHIEVESFLGTPIRYQGKSVGNLYLTGKEGQREFTEDDQKIIEMLADRAGVALEIARLYQAESAGRAWLQRVIEQMPEGVILTNDEGRVTTYNRAALALSSGEDDQPDASTSPILFDARSPEGKPLALEERPLGRAMLKGESVHGMELQLRTRDGRLVPVLASATPIRVSGQEQGKASVVVFQDISQIKELERQREEWISVVAHDLRQPLSAILLSAEILRRRAENLSPTQLRSVDNILASIKQQRKMIDDLLDVSRIQTRQVKLERQEVDLVALLPEILERAGGLTWGHEVRLSMEGDELPASVDPGRFEQVLGNLLSNAAKYGFSGTDIEVRLARRGDEAEISVTNQGKGISPEEQQNLFIRFYRTSSARADEQVKGLGLGLYICKGLVEAHGGRLWVKSTPGQTTTFSFTLPLSA